MLAVSNSWREWDLPTLAFLHLRGIGVLCEEDEDGVDVNHKWSAVTMTEVMASNAIVGGSAVMTTVRVLPSIFIEGIGRQVSTDGVEGKLNHLAVRTLL